VLTVPRPVLRMRVLFSRQYAGAHRSNMSGDILANAVVVLLLANIRNAWDVTLARARRQSARKNDGAALP
jgi:hypothetical protein